MNQLIKNSRDIFYSISASILTLLASSVFIVRFVSLQGQEDLNSYIFVVALINVIAAVFGTSISNYILKYLSSELIFKNSHRLFSTIILSVIISISALYFILIISGYFEVKYLIVLVPLILKIVLTSLLRAERQFYQILIASILEIFPVILALIFFNYINISWSIILCISYSLSALILARFCKMHFGNRSFQFSLSSSYYFDKRYLIFIVYALIESLISYGERFALKSNFGESEMTLVFKETYIFKMGSAVVIMFSGTLFSYLAKIERQKFNENSTIFFRYAVACALVISVGCASLGRWIASQFFNFEQTYSTWLLGLIYFLFYMDRLYKSIIVRYMPTKLLILKESLCFVLFLVGLLNVSQLTEQYYLIILAIYALTSSVWSYSITRRFA